MGAEIVRLVHRPTIADVLKFHEYAGSFPLHVDKGVYDGTVVVLFFLLVVERSDGRIPGRRIELRVIPAFWPRAASA